MASHTAVAAEVSRPTSPWTGGPALVACISAALLLLHLLTASRYGYFGDEMYHLACGQHLAWGYVDQPPLIALVAWLVRHTLGTSLLAIRFVPALAGAATVLLTGALARELGGGRFAQALAALCVACSPVYLVLNYLFTMNAWEPLLWTACAYVLIRIIKTGDQKLWLWFGLLSGIGLENKYSMGVFGFAVVVGLLLTPERKALAHKWIWIAGALAFAIFLPNLVWNFRHHWPFLELMRNIRASGRDVVLGPAQYLLQQIMLMNPLAFPVWLAGALYLFLSRNARPFRLLGWIFLVVFATFLASHGKDYYHRFGRRRRRPGTPHPQPVRHLDSTRFAGVVAGGDCRHPAHTSAPALARTPGFLSGKVPHQAASQRESACPGRAAALFCLAVRLAGDGAGGGARLSFPSPRSAGQNRDHRQQLRRIGRH